MDRTGLGLFKSFNSTVAVVLVSGLYGLVVSSILGYGFLLLGGSIIWPMLGIIGGGKYADATVVSGILIFKMIPFGGVIWGWTVGMLQKKTDIYFGAFLATTIPGLLLIFSGEPKTVRDLDLQPNVAPVATIFLFCMAFIFFGLTTFLDVVPDASRKQSPWQENLQNFVANSSVGRASRGGRLLIIAILAQVLALAVGRYFHNH